MSREFANDNELRHFGVKGMKWGVRKNRETANLVKAARGEERLAYRSLRKATPISSKMLGLAPNRHSAAGKNYNRALNKYVDTRQKRIEAQVKYAKEKASNPKSAAKAERKAYMKAFREVGLRDSPKSVSANNAGTKLYNSIKNTKGKAYADSLETKVTKQQYAIAAGSVAAIAGAYLVSAYTNSKY